MAGMYFLTKEEISLVTRRFLERVVKPLLLAAHNEPDETIRAVKRPFIGIVVADGQADRRRREEFVLYSASYSPIVMLDHPNRYEQYALAKAHLAARTGMSTLDVVTTRPDLLQDSDFAHPGAVVNGRIIVSVSGLDGLDDHAIATWLSVLLMKHAREGFQQVRPGTYFLGEDPQTAGELPEDPALFGASVTFRSTRRP